MSAVSSPRNRRGNLHQITLEQIKTLARRQINEGGLEALSMNAITRQVGLSGPAIYRYFASREELLDTLTHEAAADLRESLATGLEQEVVPLPAERIRLLWMVYRRWAIGHLGEYNLLIAQIRPDWDKLPSGIHFEVILGPILTQIEAHLAHQTGPVSPARRQHVYHAFWVTWVHLNGWVLLELSGRLPEGFADGESNYRAEVNRFLAELTPADGNHQDIFLD